MTLHLDFARRFAQTFGGVFLGLFLVLALVDMVEQVRLFDADDIAFGDVGNDILPMDDVIGFAFADCNQAVRIVCPYAPKASAAGP